MLNNDIKNGLIGFSIGLVVGSVLALLYAPVSGKETQKVIKNKVKEVKSKVEDTVDKVKSAVNKQKNGHI